MMNWLWPAKDAEERFHKASTRGNRYAIQRRLGFAWLLFMPELEREYQHSFFFSTRLRIRALSSMSALAVLTFIAFDQYAWSSLMITPAAWLLGAVGIPVIMSTFFATFRTRFSRELRLVIFAGFVAYGWVLTYAILWSRQVRPEMPYDSLVLLTVGVYLLSGLSLYQALFAALLLAAGFVLGSGLLGVQSHAMPYELFYLALANGIGFIGLYVLDYQSRRAFLVSNEMRLLSMQDGLTGLLNRRTFRRHIHRLQLQARREQKFLGLLRIDVDGFKQINDELGHAYGDSVLRALGRALKSLARRPMDASGRVGGDEFEIVWYDVTPEWYPEISACLRERLKQELLKAEIDASRISISGGASLIAPDHSYMISDALHRADQVLHEAKRAGRDTILYDSQPFLAMKAE